MTTIQLKAAQRLQTQVKADVDPTSVLAIKSFMKQAVALLEESAIGAGGKLGAVKELPDQYEVPGMLAPIGVNEVYFSAGRLVALGRRLQRLNEQEDAEYEIGFEVQGGKLVMVVADCSET